MTILLIIDTIPPMVDLHTHSSFSDGELTPEALVEQAASQGLSAIALTDHDTINGLERAKIAALGCNTGKNLKLIPGIEININWSGEKGVSGLGNGGEFHLLGLGINTPSPAFRAAIDELSRSREVRNRKILDKMHELGIDATWEELLALSGGHLLCRPHFAALLIKRNIVKNQDQAFARYLGAGKLLYEPKGGLVFEEAVTLIRESGGIPVLAHPISLYVAWGRLPDLIKALKDRGLMGLEAWHPTAKPGSCRRLEALAKELGLYVTEGSDFHGSVRPDRKLGHSSKGRKINDAILEAIPELFTDSR